MEKTIKVMVVAKLQERNRSTDDDAIKCVIGKHVKQICRAFPNDTPAGREFSDFITKDMPQAEQTTPKIISGRKVKILAGHEIDEIFDKAIESLIDKAMDEQDDLTGMVSLRACLVESIRERGLFS